MHCGQHVVEDPRSLQRRLERDTLPSPEDLTAAVIDERLRQGLSRVQVRPVGTLDQHDLFRLSRQEAQRPPDGDGRRDFGRPRRVRIRARLQGPRGMPKSW